MLKGSFALCLEIVIVFLISCRYGKNESAFLRCFLFGMLNVTDKSLGLSCSKEIILLPCAECLFNK